MIHNKIVFKKDFNYAYPKSHTDNIFLLYMSFIFNMTVTTCTPNYIGLHPPPSRENRRMLLFKSLLFMPRPTPIQTIACGLYDTRISPDLFSTQISNVIDMVRKDESIVHSLFQHLQLTSNNFHCLK